MVPGEVQTWLHEAFFHLEHFNTFKSFKLLKNNCPNNHGNVEFSSRTNATKYNLILAQSSKSVLRAYLFFGCISEFQSRVTSK